MTVQGEQCPLCKKDRADCACDAPKDNVATRPAESGSERKMFHIKRRELPKTVVGENECGICGMTLEDSVCPMCGWSPRLSKVDDAYRCPFGGSILDDGDACKDCGRAIGDLEKADSEEFKTPIDFSCPICLKKINLTDDSCPHCAARIWLDVEGELENLDVLRCPKCQFENREGAKFCGKCRSRLLTLCPACSSQNSPDNVFCDECGHDLKKPKETPSIDYSQPQSYTPRFLAEKTADRSRRRPS